MSHVPDMGPGHGTGTWDGTWDRDMGRDMGHGTYIQFENQYSENLFFFPYMTSNTELFHHTFFFVFCKIGLQELAWGSFDADFDSRLEFEPFRAQLQLKKIIFNEKLFWPKSHISEKSKIENLKIVYTSGTWDMGLGREDMGHGTFIFKKIFIILCPMSHVPAPCPPAPIPQRGATPCPPAPCPMSHVLIYQ